VYPKRVAEFALATAILVLSAAVWRSLIQGGEQGRHAATLDWKALPTYVAREALKRRAIRLMAPEGVDEPSSALAPREGSGQVRKAPPRVSHPSCRVRTLRHPQVK
jgi:hypothetical protein